MLIVNPTGDCGIAEYSGFAGCHGFCDVGYWVRQELWVRLESSLDFRGRVGWQLLQVGSNWESLSCSRIRGIVSFIRLTRRTTISAKRSASSTSNLYMVASHKTLPHSDVRSRTLPTVYCVEDGEIESGHVSRKITLPKPLLWTTRWLAVEGAQPLISENPPAIPKTRKHPLFSSHSPASLRHPPSRLSPP